VLTGGPKIGLAREENRSTPTELISKVARPALKDTLDFMCQFEFICTLLVMCPPWWELCEIFQCAGSMLALEIWEGEGLL
jgi:hypothetical protein